MPSLSYTRYAMSTLTLFIYITKKRHKYHIHLQVRYTLIIIVLMPYSMQLLFKAILDYSVNVISNVASV